MGGGSVKNQRTKEMRMRISFCSYRIVLSILYCTHDSRQGSGVNGSGGGGYDGGGKWLWFQNTN